MKTLTAFIKTLIYSNIFVSLCVTAFTHLTYIIYNLPKDNLIVILVMVFNFTFLTYNGQRLFRLNQRLYLIKDIGEHLAWVKSNQKILIFLSILAGIIGTICLNMLSFKSVFILIPTGIISFFYVVPLIPFLHKNRTLRDIPYLKIILIAFVWSITIIWLPILNLKNNIEFENEHTIIAIIQTALFVIAITIPFDIRDLAYDRSNNLKTIPQLLGIKGALTLSSLLLTCSGTLLFLLPMTAKHTYALTIGIIITITLILFTKKNRKELFFAGLIEGTVLILYCCVLIADYLYFL